MQRQKHHAASHHARGTAGTLWRGPRLTPPSFLVDTRASFRFSTDDLPEAIRAKAVRELYERAQAGQD